MSNILVRINGRGNAWPVLLGQDHPFYDRNNIQDLANASCSVIKSDEVNPKTNEIQWELMIDAGHGAVQYLLKNCNRIPEALFITHPHIDHTLGMDWIVQSYFKLYKKKYPVYATSPCWEITKSTFPQLEELIDFRDLVPFQTRKVNEVEGSTVTAYPVYHGNSAIGASMLLFEIEEKNKSVKALFTGDVLCPLLRKEDYANIQNIDLLVCDANNRFPYPKSNHWSITDGKSGQQSKFLQGFINESSIGTLLSPHLKHISFESYSRCFDYFLNSEYHPKAFHFTAESFINAIKPQKVAFIHYSGSEDEKHYESRILNDSELINWIEKNIRNAPSHIRFYVPYVSQHMELITTLKTNT
ncbi:MAG: hypothetical protein KQH79_06045 [Bacteroidetes bacterium]|nr:hypothetical protein [Bacteroidota bacterium]